MGEADESDDEPSSQSSSSSNRVRLAALFPSLLDESSYLYVRSAWLGYGETGRLVGCGDHWGVMTDRGVFNATQEELGGVWGVYR